MWACEEDELDDQAFLDVDLDRVHEEYCSQRSSQPSDSTPATQRFPFSSSQPELAASSANPSVSSEGVLLLSSERAKLRPIEECLLPFQREGVQKAIGWGGRVLLGDEMGLGKTIQSIAIARYYQNEWPLLVICPTSLSGVWADELERWCPNLLPGDINLVKSYHNSALTTSPVTILTYGLVTNGKEKEQLAANIKEANFSTVIVDEAHYLKGRDTVRSKLLLPILAGAHRCIMLTGTPALNRPVELFPLLTTLRPGQAEWKTYTAFVNRYCAAKPTFYGRRRGLDVSGSSNEAELYALLSRLLMVRRLKADVLTQLPPKRRQRVLVTLSPQSSRTLDALRKEADALPQGQSFERQNILSKMVTELARAKVNATAEYVLELTASCDRLLFFAHHLCMLDGIEAAAAAKGVRTLRIDGATPASERQAIVRKFESAPGGKPLVFILSVLAAGQGLTLTSASTVVFGELRWVPGELLQAEDRAHRIGQLNAVNVHYVCAKGTVDEAMWRVLQRKVRTLGASLNGVSSSLRAEASAWHTADSRRAESDTTAPSIGPTESCAEAEPTDQAAEGEVMGVEQARHLQNVEAKRAAERAAFKQLFAPRSSMAAQELTNRKASSNREGDPRLHATGTSKEPINLDDNVTSAASAIVCMLDVESEGALCDQGEAEAWFAISSLTGRLHAFGDGPAPLEGGLGANAVVHAIVDADEENLPAALREPTMLRMAQIWLAQWDRLSSGQKAALVDKPLQNPMRAAANTSRRSGKRSGEQGEAQAGTDGSGTSTVRQTSARRWAEGRRPPGKPDVDYTTREWRTEGARQNHTWWQHFSLHSGLPHCLVCLLEHEARRNSPFCSEKCAASYGAAASQAYGRRQIYDRDHGVCATCGFDAHELFRVISALPTSAERMQVLMQTHYSTSSDRVARMLRCPKEGDFWEADHILPVEEGGGECDLLNLQTLCVPCHAAKTRKQQVESKARKRQKAANGSADLRGFFGRTSPSSTVDLSQ